MSKAFTINIYTTMAEPVAVQGVKHGLLVRWILRDWVNGGRKILKRMYRPVVEQGIWGMRTDQELREL